MPMKKDLSHYAQALEAERTKLIGELNTIGVVTNAKNPDEWQAVPTEGEHDLPDANEVADRIESYEENIALVSELETRLREVDCALKCIKEGMYGNCEICKSIIEADRLDANPAARTCKAHMNARLGIPAII